MQQSLDSMASQSTSLGRRHPTRGELIDIGGRRLHVVRAGPKTSERPLVVCEHGAFGCAADWAEVQAQLASEDLRSLAYDRAGLGYSDPGPRPRDGHGVVADLELLLGRAAEPGPYVLVAHSMAGLFARLFAARRSEQVAGVVMVDAVTPETTEGWAFAAGLEVFRGAVRVVGWSAGTGFMRPVSLVMGNRIGVTGEAAVEKRRIYGSAFHTRGSAEEVRRWPAAAMQGRKAGPIPPDIPVAVITAGDERASPGLKAMQVAPALASRRGHVAHVAGSNHANLLGPRFAHRIVAGVRHVLSACA